MQQETATNDERPSRERKRPAKFRDFDANFNSSESSELDDESEQEGAARALKRQKKNEKSEADKKGAKQRTLRLKNPKAYAKKLENNRKWKAKKKKESPDYADSEKKKKKDWRDKKMKADPDCFKNYSKAWRKRNPDYFKAWRKRMRVKNPNYFKNYYKDVKKDYKHLTLLRPVKHFEDYFEAAKKEAEKKHQTSKRSIGDWSHVFDHALHQDPLLAKSLEEHAQAPALSIQSAQQSGPAQYSVSLMMHKYEQQ